MQVVKFAESNQIILSEEEQQGIIDKFPEKLRPFLNSVNNPLDETQILVNLFKDKNVRIILKKEENDFGICEYVGYFHASDIATIVKYDNKHVTQWKTRWKIKLVKYADLMVSQNERPYLNYKNIDSNALFISEQELKKVLLKNKYTRSTNIPRLDIKTIVNL